MKLHTAEPSRKRNIVKITQVIASAICLCALAMMPGTQPQAHAATTATLDHWKTADEITFAGPIHEIVSKHVSGTPAGLNLLMDGSQTTLYINLGTALDSATQKSLAVGQVIQVKGIVRSFNGTNYLLARDLTLGQQALKIRNAHGMPTKVSATAVKQGNRPRGKRTVAGGAQ